MIIQNEYKKYYKGDLRSSELPEDFKTAVILYLRSFYKTKRIDLSKDYRFGLYEVPLMVLVQDLDKVSQPQGAFSRDQIGYDSKNFECVWPVFLDRDFGCILEDGSGRLHSYVEQGVEIVPCLLMGGSK